MPVFPETPVVPGEPGSLITVPYQYEFRGLLFGSQTSYITEKVTGLHSLPGIRDQDIDNVSDHGASPGMLLMTKRVVAFDMKIVGAAGEDIESKINLARETFQIPRMRYSRVLEPFVFWRPGEPKKVLYVRTTKRDIPSDYDTARGLGSGSIELVAPNPVILDLESKHAETTLAVDVQNGELLLHSDGNYLDGARPLIQIDGPWDNPRIQNEDDDNRTIRIDVSLAAVDSMLIDVRNQTILVRRGLAGAWVDGYEYRRADNQWWAVLPGENHINATRAATNDGANGKISIDWQDAYS